MSYLNNVNHRKNRKSPDAVYPIVGKIIIGNTIAQFGSKLKIEERLWNVKSGRAIGKSRIAVELNREINFINLSIHAHYREILKRTGKVTAIEVKNTFQGIVTAQKTLLILFGEMMEDFNASIKGKSNSVSGISPTWYSSRRNCLSCL